MTERMDKVGKADKNFGLYWMTTGIVTWAFVIYKIIMNIPVKTGTFILLSWPILPGIVCGYIFYLMDKNDLWREPRENRF